MKKGQVGVAIVIIILLVIIGVLLIVQFFNYNVFNITGSVISEIPSISGEIQTREYSLSDFNKIKIKGKGNLFLTQANEFSIRIEADKNILDLIDVDVVNGELIIGDEKLIFIRNTPINIFVSMPDIERVVISGSGDIVSENKIVGEDLEIKISGSGDINLDVDLEKLKTKISGSGDAFYVGDVNIHEIIISGSGDIDALDLFSDISDITISGSGDAKIYANEELSIVISGSGSVNYRGSPKINQRISGVGKISGF